MDNLPADHRYKESEINQGQQGNHGRDPEKLKSWAESANQEVGHNVGHPPGYQARGQAAGQKYTDMKINATPDKVHGVPVNISENRMRAFYR